MPGPTSSPPGRPRSTTSARAYAEQLEFIEGEGAPAIVMAARALCAAATSADDYRAVYGELLAQASTRR